MASSLELDARTDQAAQLTPMNWAILVTFILNAGSTAMSANAVFGPTNPELSAKYSTIITPAGGAFAIWGPIFISEAVFAMAQLLPAYRINNIVLLAAPWYISACLFQTTWNVAFGTETITLAVICMFGIAVSLVGLCLYVDTNTDYTVPHFWLLRATHSLHTAWIIAASAVNLSVYAVSIKANASQQLGIAISSLVVVFTLAVVMGTAIRKPDPFFAFVTAWAAYWINAELQDPQGLLNSNRELYVKWDLDTIIGVKFASAFLAVAALGLTLVATGLRYQREQQKLIGSAAEVALSA